ncbi:MAG: hypothetical protein RDV48_15320 [Candidatus Eremiobacteraeota bacterium]|nr:hypothetical protein [Candidatus Eremiobacteraeota bacterium]
MKKMRSIFLAICALLSFLSHGAYGAEGSAGQEVRFRFLMAPGKTHALIDLVKVLNDKGEVIASLDLGDGNDTAGQNRISLDDADRWGDAVTLDSRTARPVNGKEVKSEHSGFQLFLPVLPKEGKLRIRISYKDLGEDLMPVEIFDGEEFRRIAQILLENSGDWLEEEYAIPAIDIKQVH